MSVLFKEQAHWKHYLEIDRETVSYVVFGDWSLELSSCSVMISLNVLVLFQAQASCG